MPKATTPKEKIMFQGRRMDTAEMTLRINAVIRSIRKRERATIDDLVADIDLDERTINRIVAYLRQEEKVELVSEINVFPRRRAYYALAPLLDERSKGVPIKRRLIAAEDWKRGEHCQYAAAWPPVARPATTAAR